MASAATNEHFVKKCPHPSHGFWQPDQDTLQTLVETGSLRELPAVREGEGWALHGRLGTSWLPVRSRRKLCAFGGL
jgi:hypothetical protein